MGKATHCLYTGRVIRLFPFLLLLFLFAPANAQLARGEKAMAVELLAEHDAPTTGGRLTLALRMKPRPGWHGYWKNPGDAGVETRIDWTLPPGVNAGPIQFPVPERLLVAGFMNYVYKGDFTHLIDVEIPPGLTPGTRLQLRGRLFYVVCTDKVCVPEDSPIALDLRVSANPPRTARFDEYREALPRPIGGEARFASDGGKVRIAIPIPAALPLDDPYFFPLTPDALDHSAPQHLSRRGDLLIVETEAGKVPAPTLEGVLRIGPADGLTVTARPGAVPAAGDPVSGSFADSDGLGVVLAALGAAILGGLLLNVMPCVFPILSLKALSLSRAGGEEKAVRREALAYTAGAILTCAALGGAILALRAGGSAAGWAFQLQDPRVILLLLLLVTAIALNLFGLFELPAFAGGDRLTRGHGPAGAFWTGALAAFVATPCTGPFMGAALGAALLLPTAAALAVFAGLGLGLALPFLLLGFVPALRRRLPKPGPWMVRFRHILAVPMALTALALLWILWRQTGERGLLLGAAAALLLALALWWAGRGRAAVRLAPASLLAVAAIALAPPPVSPAVARARGALDAQPFSEASLARLRSEGRPVFVYFTADWCLTCKVNEAGVLERSDVARAFEKGRLAVLVGDWTRGDAGIGRFLGRHGRAGIPLYLYYPPGGEAVILPQILTTATVLEAVATRPAR